LGQALISREGDYSFEEVLSAYHPIVGEEELLKMMRDHFLVEKKDFPQKTLITLFNECLAHLCRERLVDFIVSLNFDELLEHSLNEDIGSDDYVAIHNPARFQWALNHGLSREEDYKNTDQRNSESGCELAKPWLLKPHGTISHENTLRNLVDQVWRFEKAKEDVLKEVFKNSHVVVVGFSLSAADIHRVLPPFRHILRSYLFRPGSIPCTFENRFLAERVYFAVRMKGWFSSRSLGKSHQIQYLLKQSTKSEREILFSLPEKLEPAFVSILIKGRAERIYFLRKKAPVGSSPFTELYDKVFVFFKSKSSILFEKILNEIGKKMIGAIQQATEADMAVYSDYEDIGTFNRVCMIPNRVVLNALTDWLLSESKDGFDIITEIGSFLKNRSIDFSKVDLTVANYSKISASIASRFGTFPQGKKYIWIDDIIFSENQVKRWIEKKDLREFRMMDIEKKRLHFTLRKEGNKIKGILYNRLFCQAGATFYWVELVVNDQHPDDKHQFEALQFYMSLSAPPKKKFRKNLITTARGRRL